MRRLVDDLLDFSQLSNRKIALHPRPVGLGELLRSIAEAGRRV